jgi:DNA-binding CsgD family transcriptional regulator
LTYDRRPGATGSRRFLLHNYPKSWARTYTLLNLRVVDPVQRVCDKAAMGFGWKDMGDYVSLHPSDLRLMDAAEENGLADGYTVPRHLPGTGSGSCSFVVGPDTLFPQEMRYVAELVGAGAVFNALKRFEPFSLRKQRPLTERQRECLIWLARGKTHAEIAIILGISVQTVDHHLRGARERYDVHCRQQLILCAVYDGLISFSDIFDWRHRD